MRPLRLIVLIVVLLAVVGGGLYLNHRLSGQDGEGVLLALKVQGLVDKPHLIQNADGEFRYHITTDKGEALDLSPVEFSQLLYDVGATKHWWSQILNISSPWGVAWVLLGLCGQLLFSGRMIIQWLVSERAKKSIVPPAFWWLSLAGASMLMMYFIWRADIVGILGQGTGWLIYTRNLWLIYMKPAGGSTDLVQPGDMPDEVVEQVST